MGIDAVALLRIPNFIPPLDGVGYQRSAEHRGDASLLNTMIRVGELPPDEHALHLRQFLSEALDQHRDERGIFFFPDSCEPRGQSYDAIVSELSGVGFWAPQVTLDHVPLKYTSATQGSHEALVLRLIQAFGRDTALSMELTAALDVRAVYAGEASEASAQHAQDLAQVTDALGADFAERYRASVAAEVERQLTEEAARANEQTELFASLPINLDPSASEPVSDEDFAKWLARVQAEVDALPAEQRAALERTEFRFRS